MNELAKSCCLEEVAFKWMLHCEFLKSLHEQCRRYENENTDNVVRFLTFLLNVFVCLPVCALFQTMNVGCNGGQVRLFLPDNKPFNELLLFSFV